MIKTKEHHMIKTSILMESIECVGYAHFTALASDLNWNADFQPDFVDVEGLGNGNSLQLVAVTNFGMVKSLKYSQPGAFLYLTVIGA